MELDVVYQRYLDESAYCGICSASMYWVDGESSLGPVQYHVCTSCGHCLAERGTVLCQCSSCLIERGKKIRSVALEERSKLLSEIHEKTGKSSVSISNLSLLDKLYLYSVLDYSVNDEALYSESINFNHINRLSVAPTRQIYKQLLSKFVIDLYVVPTEVNEDSNYYFNLNINGYSEPSLRAMLEHLRHDFDGKLETRVPYKNTEEVKDVLLVILAHEAVQFCCQVCQSMNVEFYANQKIIEFFKESLLVWSPTQLFNQIQRATTYLNNQGALSPTNENLLNTNRIKKTLEQYKNIMTENKWEVSTTPRFDYPYSKMTEVFLFDFLGFGVEVFNQPFWKNWNDVYPRLRFFEECHCVHCGGNNLNIEHSDISYISFRCVDCRILDHYFIK